MISSSAADQFCQLLQLEVIRRLTLGQGRRGEELEPRENGYFLLHEIHQPSSYSTRTSKLMQVPLFHLKFPLKWEGRRKENEGRGKGSTMHGKKRKGAIG
jgi:hypothetical protein